MGDKQQDSVERPADGNKNQTSNSLQQVTASGNSKRRKKKRGKKKRSAEKMEDKEGEMGKSTPLQSVLVQPQSEESNPAKFLSVQPDPPLGQSNREKTTPEQPIPEQPKPETPKLAQRNPAQPSTGHQNPATLPSALSPHQSSPDQPDQSSPHQSSQDQSSPDQPDQSSPHQSSPDQSSPHQSSPDQPDQSSPHQSSPDQSSPHQSSPDQPEQSSPHQSSPDQSSPQQSSPDQPEQSSPHQSSQDQSSPQQSSPDQPEQSSPHQSSQDQSSPQQSSPDQPDQSSPHQSSPDQSSPQQSSPDQPDQSSESSPDEEKPKKKGDPNKLTLLTWNIDGLDLDDIKERLSKLLDYLIKYHPDIVLLQEVISPIYQVLQQVLKPYHLLPGSDRSYFTAILLRKSRVQLLESSLVNYPTTEMRRNLLMAHVSFLGHPLCVMTSHMESMKPKSLERQNQLRTVWKTMREQPQDCSVIFGGDTNLRDWEVKNQGGLPESICDVWESLGQPEDCRYTWDCVTNDNKDLPFPARLRFDRIFLRQAGKGSKVSPDGMTLVGLKRLDDCQRFTSDHWGLLCTFVIKPLSQATPE
ncbi:tyrosyl-DNA phosphodiesterase 2 isoform X2 [Salmo salar]|uniref:Tyrosyl-DNA phosphodiesterase 2 n=1 Tax=Salmo salar TaxID=8030 RepID=A0A1S3NP84_SALSA|nr:tyrosyl-DNA phosphodiesterase 2 isoform X2 [Salmo salar]XP_045558550.1 tyrosyl-DNA phosphodiesterase 2 isoform X2 [Salmo salar]|eukprot:XP_014017060.1 PREDICTED: tyrosyl-DNA phosphodiesterase 2-like isoform X2 [Salmo salar]